MYNGKKIYVMIPARAGSKRLKNKNIQLLLGKPLMSYAINACKKSKYVDEIYVSTEDTKIAEIAEEYGAKVLERPKELAEDHVRSQDVMKHFADSLKEFDIMVLVQANSPQINPENIDKAVKLLEDNNLWEVRSVDSKGLENGAFWVTKRKTIYWDGLSVYFGIVLDDSVDIHTPEDLELAEKRIKEDLAMKNMKN